MNAPSCSWYLPLLVASALLPAGCGRDEAPSTAAVREPVADARRSPLRIALAPHVGSGAIDDEIRAAQRAAADDPSEVHLERLAAGLITKARASADPGYYRLAEAAANAMPDADTPPALLIRGHVRHALHDFPAAERIARRLVADRGMFLDLGLLGDVLLDLGNFDEAGLVYQRMLDTKPCLQSYARAAEVRWRGGDLAGARELLALAAKAGSRRAPEPLAWVLSRQAELAMFANEPDVATRLADEALAHVADYPAALAVRGRAAAARGDLAAAKADLAVAADRSSLPAHLWAHADVLHADGDAHGADAIADRLDRSGEREDPRTFSLWLATSNRDCKRALAIAERELQLRQDCMTFDAVAWARLRAGDTVGARTAIARALARPTRDARLLLHAAFVSHASGDPDQARSHLAAASTGTDALLPSERALLAELRREL